jgi:hypothetical protein
MTGKDPKEYDVDEVCLWLNAIGLDSKVDAFRENAVDGDMLVALTAEDLTNELGLSNLQAKKVLQKLEFSKELAAEGGGGGGVDDGGIKELEAKISELEAENAALKAQLEEYQPKQAPAPAPPPKQAPAPAPPPKHYRNEHEVVRGAAGGAARGAVLGAVGGAIAGDPGKGAKMGAAMGATGGGMRGIAAKRRNRMR